MHTSPTGIHHLTAITADAPGNLAFYTRTLGLRLVKKTVNQDDTSAYHLFYADGLATPGTDVTFFDWAQLPRERRGTRSISRTALRVAGAETLNWWAERFDELSVPHGPVVKVDGRLTLEFEDPEGQRLALIDDGGAGTSHPWDASSVPAAHQIRGLGPITLSVPQLEPTDIVLTQVLNMRAARVYATAEQPPLQTHVYEMGTGGAAAELHVAVDPTLPVARQGAGGVHHVAFRVPDRAALEDWTARLNAVRLPNSGEVERYYFRSLYFREPNGILFELATDGPGFAVDEDISELGERLALPPFLEPQRAAIEEGLAPLDLPTATTAAERAS
jgi:glyoxalase family protein